MKKQNEANKKHGTMLKVNTSCTLNNGSSSETTRPKITEVISIAKLVTIINIDITADSKPGGAVNVIIESDGAAVPSQRNSSTATKKSASQKLKKK